MPDPRAEPPEEKPTVELAAPPPWAVEMAKNVSFVKAHVEALANDFTTLKGDVRILQQWKIDEERRRESMPPTPSPITSERVRAVVDSHISQSDLEQQAKLAEIVVKDQERDRRIEETHALVLQAATKDDVQKIVDSTATKAEVKELVEAAADAQTEKLVARLNAILQKPYVKLAITALGAFITGWLASHGVTIK